MSVVLDTLIIQKKLNNIKTLLNIAVMTGLHDITGVNALSEVNLRHSFQPYPTIGEVLPRFRLPIDLVVFSSCMSRPTGGKSQGQSFVKLPNFEFLTKN